MKEISLTRGLSTIVDNLDFNLNEYKWRAVEGTNTFYAVRTVQGNEKSKRKHELLHRVIMKRILRENGNFRLLKTMSENPRKYFVDHINGDGLLNTRDNLRVVSHRQNTQNRFHKKKSKYPGVSKRADIKKWNAYIRLNGKQIHLGYYNTEKEAFEAYKKAVEEYTEESFLENINTGKILKKPSVKKTKFTSRYVGVSFCNTTKKWRACIKNKHIGYFETEIEAHKAVKKAIYNYERGMPILSVRKRPKSSKYKGVSLNKKSGRWRADIYIKGKVKCLGFFDSEDEAHEAYNSVTLG